MLNPIGHAVACLALLTGGAPAGLPPLKVRDPAPPKVHAPTTMPAPLRAMPYAGLRELARPHALAKGAVTSDWAAFLGPTHNAVCPETKLRKDLRGGAAAAPGKPAGPRLLWDKATGSGYAAPAIVGRRLVMIHRLEDQEVVECLDAETGRRYWRFAYPTTYSDRFNYNGGPRASPVIAGGRVYTFGAQSKLHCFDLAGGQVIWKRDLSRDFRLRSSYFGAGCSPLIEGGLVILNIGVAGGPSVVAFDAGTGRLAWGAEKDWGAGYASPVPATIHGKRVVFVFAGGESDPPTGGLICLDPRTGATHFRYPFRSGRVASVNASSPVVVGDSVFVSSHYDIGGVLLRVKPDLTPTVAWRVPEYGAHWMTPIVRGKHLYGFSETELMCIERATGRVAWSTIPRNPAKGAEDPLGLPSRMGRASLLWADGAFLCQTEYGGLCWMNLTPKGMKIAAAAKLFHARQTWTCPVISHGLLYICQNETDYRTNTGPRLLCYDLRGPE